jgi:hypothetical protein
MQKDLYGRSLRSAIPVDPMLLSPKIFEDVDNPAGQICAMSPSTSTVMPLKKQAASHIDLASRLDSVLSYRVQSKLNRA